VLTINEATGETADYTLDPRMVQLPAPLAVSALEVRPRTLSLSLERIETRLVPVRPRIIDSLEEGWVLLDAVALDPAEVRVTGPLAQIASVTEIFTLPFEITVADTVLRRAIELDTIGIGSLDYGATSVNVTGRVDRIVDRVLSGVSVDVVAGVTAMPSVVDVRLRGPERLVSAVQAAAVRVVVPVERLVGTLARDGIILPLRVVGVQPGVNATVVPAQVTVSPISPPTDDLQPRAPAPSAEPSPPTNTAAPTPDSGQGTPPADAGGAPVPAPVGMQPLPVPSSSSPV
jgi:hypothetical protein